LTDRATHRSFADAMSHTGFLSFNEQLGGKQNFGIPEEEDDEVAEALREPMKLKDNWVLWEQVVPNETTGKATSYNDNTHKVTKFTTVQDFWGIWNGLPQPSELLDQKRIMRNQSNGQSVAIDAIMIFKEGINPEWEHPMNANGGHFQMQLKPSMGGGQIDELWNNIVLGMIGGTIEHNELITGVRLVDKLSGPKNANAIRIELWFTKYENQPAVNALRKSMEKIMNTRIDGSQGSAMPKPDTKSHNTMSKH